MFLCHVPDMLQKKAMGTRAAAKTQSLNVLVNAILQKFVNKKWLQSEQIYTNVVLPNIVISEFFSLKSKNYANFEN